MRIRTIKPEFISHDGIFEAEPMDTDGEELEDGAESMDTEGDELEDGAGALAVSTAFAGAGDKSFVPRTQVEHLAAFVCRLLRWLSAPESRMTGQQHDTATAARVQVALFVLAPEASEFASLADIGRRYGISRERVRQLADAAFPRHVDAS